jgi:nitrite reductase/ring-hydroxylating ferredoxin subunit
VRRWIRVAPRQELANGEARAVPLEPDELGYRREAIVLIDENGEPRAYLNRCQHIPIPIDSGSGDFFDRDRLHLRCLTHGALYRPIDGFCIAGPCKGESLIALPVQIDAEGWILLDPS